MNPHLKVLSGVFIDVGRAHYAKSPNFGGQRNGAADFGRCTHHGLHDLLGRLVDYFVVVRLEPNSNFLTFRTRHRRRLSSIELLEDLDDSTRTHGATTLTDGEAETFLHGDWSNQLHRHFGVVSRHDHFGALGQLN